MIRVGLTGSIGMGKSTTADMFRAEGIPVIDADSIVHDLYRSRAVEPISVLFPGAIKDGQVDRASLSRLLAENPAKFKELEAIVHPLVREDEKSKLDVLERRGEKIVVLDIPLLFEKRLEASVDIIVVVSCDPATQKERVMVRPGMTEEKFRMILDRQTPDREKRARADYVIETGSGIEPARHQVKRILKEVGGRI